MKIRSAKIVAALIALNMKRYGDERGREVTRIALNIDRVSSLFGYVDGIIPESEIKQLDFELRQLGYLFLRLSSTHFGMLLKRSTVNWGRIAVDRIADVLDSSPEYLYRLLQESNGRPLQTESSED